MKEWHKYPRFLTPKEAAEILRLSLAAFYKKSWMGIIPTTKVGGSLRVDKNKLEEYLEKRTRGGEL